MSLFFRKSSLRRATTNLKSQLDTFRGFTNEPLYPQGACEKAAYCSKTIAALENSISLIQSAKNELVILIDSVEQDYAEIKKPEKSSFLEEFQQVANEIRYEETLTETDAMLCALKTRLAEVRHEHTLAKKDIQKDVGKEIHEIDEECFEDQESQHKFHVRDKGISADFTNTSQHAMECSDHQDTVATVRPPLRDIDAISESLQNTRTSIKPPQVSVPRFSGNAEDFQEFWAIFQAVVHENSSLNKMEKMILLKESLVGRAAITIKGIKMIPKNYEWMIEALKKKYDNVTSARANIIHRLSNLQHTKDSTGETVFDELRSLVNEMVSSGYNVVVTRDPMWTEAILQRLPKHIVEEFLRENKDGESLTIGETLDRIEAVITRYKYINQRMRSQEDSLSPTHPPQKTSAFLGRNKICYFCGRNNHMTFQCRTVHEPSERRKVAMEQNLCWKCFSKDHRSNECSRPNCSICAKLHDTTLCLRKTSETVMQRPPTDERQQAIKPTTKTRANTNASNAHQHDTVRTYKAINAFSPMTNDPNCTRSTVTDLDQIVLMTAEGSVWNNNTNSYERALFFFDTGAQLSLVEEKSAEHLALPVLASDQCTLSGISGISETFVSHHVQLRVLTAHGRELKMTMQTKPTLTRGFPAVRLMEPDIEFMEENSIQLANTRLRGEHQVPQILVGIDLYGIFIPENSPPVQLPTGLRVTKTVFGFAAYGRGNTAAQSNMNESDDKLCNTAIIEEMTEADMIKNMFELESLGISTKEGLNDHKNPHRESTVLANGSHDIHRYYCVLDRDLDALRGLTQAPQEHAPFTLASFRPALLPPALSVAMLTCLGLITGGYSCQEGYMRHSAELKCTQRHECHYEFRHELMFNRVTQHLCILLRHENSTVGYIKIRRTSVRFECQKESLFWTKETKHAVRSVTRCRGLGSCIGTTCETLNPNQIVPELNDSMPSPGYTACSIQCSGIDCICPFPIRACTFYSVRHVPVSQSSFEIFRCSGWQPLVTFEISLQAYKMREQQTIALLPYASKQLGNFNLLLNSISNTQFSHTQKFALSQKETFAIPDSFVFPIQCDSEQKAERNFSYCHNMNYCDCDVSGVTPNCRCPHNELSALRRNPQYSLPVSTPYASILREANTIIAETDQTETTVVISSQQRFEGAHLNMDAPCTIHAGILEGCYSCHQGSQISIACYSIIPSWTTIVCAHHIFSLECSPSNKTSTIKITFDRAVVSSQCYTICGGKNVTVGISGMYYHASESLEEVLHSNGTRTIPQTDWFEDLHLPDLSPLWIVALKHWKLTLAITSFFAIALLLTYLFGPIVILTLAKILAKTAVLLVQLLFAILHIGAEIATACSHGIQKMKQQSR